MTDATPTDEQAVLNELRQELTRLEAEHAKAIQKRDEVFSVVENGDDSGYALSMALNELRKIEKRMEQVRNLFEQKQKQQQSRPSSNR